MNATSAVPNLAGKVALVTGASKGIGAEIAKTLALAGASVVVNYASSRTDADKVVQEISRQGGDALAVQGDVSQPEAIEKLVSATIDRFGKIDILVNNAGVYAFTPIDTLTTDAVDRMFNVNVRGALLTTQAAVAHFPESGGSIINIGSVIGEIAPGMASVYAGTKGAINSITRSLAKELGPRHIRVNAVNPGPIVTEGFKSAGFEGDVEASMVAQTPLGRVGQPADVASIVAFLVSDAAGWVTGSLVDAAGGFR